MDATAFIDWFGQVKASAILRTSLKDRVKPAIEAAARGGFQALEVTLTTPHALEHIAEFARRPGLVMGAGTVLTAQDARAAVAAGARFLVSPVVDEVVIEEAQRLGVAVIPGCSTPTELQRAYRAGAPLQKLFPAPAGGPQFVKACLGPLPHLRIVPTAGVDEENAGEWIRAGAFGVGFVASLFHGGDVEAGRFDQIEARARRCLRAVRGDHAGSR